MPTATHLRRGPAAVLAVVLGFALASSTSEARTSRSKPFDRPPYRQGDGSVDGANVVHLAPVVVGLPEAPDAWLPRAPLARLAADLDRFVGELSLSRPADASFPEGALEQAPAIFFGCELDEIGECDTEVRRNVLVTTGGSRHWREAVAPELLRRAGADHVLVLELRLAPWWIQQKNLSGRKEVRLGTGYVQPLPWLTSLDSPVWVLEIAGALVDAEGRVVRSGAEGIRAVRTPFRASMLGAERLMRDEEVEEIRTTLLRDDLPERPLAWQAATRELVRDLLGR